MHAEHQEEARRDTAADHTLYTPPAMGHADRVAHHLLGRYRRKSLPECQHAVARMYGHAGWTSLQAAVAAGLSASAFDEDERPEVVEARRVRQRDVALVWLAGVDADTARAAQSLDEDLLSHATHSISQRYDPLYNRKRLDRARYVYNLAYAKQVIAEVRPTSRAAPEIPRNDDEIELGLRVDLLPRALKSWLCHHRPLLERWSGMIGGMRVRQRCPAELLDFSFAWGELCLLHGIDVPKALQVYPIALCAQWYAWLACLESPSLKPDLAVLGEGSADEERRTRAQRAVRAALRYEEDRFMLAQPREDFRTLRPSAREQQMHSGHAAVRRYMSDAAAEQTIKTILSKPDSSLWAAAVPATV